MEKVFFVSNLYDENQRGGAYLRVQGLVKAFEYWGFKLQLIFKRDLREKSSLLTWLVPFFFGKGPQFIFRSGKIEVPKAQIVIIDSIKFLRFNFQFKGERPTLVLNCHNLEFENCYPRNLKFYQKLQRFLFKFYELKLMSKADKILVCSAREKNILIKLRPEFKDRVEVFPNLVDASLYENDLEEKNLISFIGTLDYYPNTVAVKNIFNLIVPSLGDLSQKLIIAGRNPSKELRKECEKNNIQLKADLKEEEILDLYKKTKVFIVPLQDGSGTRLKIIEALFSHCHVVSTPMGAEGITSSTLNICSLEEFPQAIVENYQKESSPHKTDNLLYKNFDLTTWIREHKDQFLVFLGSS